MPQRAQGVAILSWMEDSRVILSNLTPYAQYGITVRTLTSAGESGDIMYYNII